jgi:hypothetical protein
MKTPEPADGWPDRPLSEAEATDRLDDDAVAIWVMDPDAGVRSVAVPSDAPTDPIVDLVIETQTAFEMYSYTGGRWMDYGTQRKDDETAPSMAGTLASYRILDGESDLDLE